MQKVLGPIRRLQLTQCTLRQASIRESKRSIAEQNTSRTLLDQRGPYAVKFEDRSQEETERQERCARWDAWRLAKNICKLKEKEEAAFSSLTDEWSLLAAATKTGRKGVCSGFWSEYAHGQRSRPWLCWVGDYEDTEEFDDGDDGARRKPEKKRRFMSDKWTYLSKLCFLKKLQQFFHLEDSAKITSKNTIGPVGQSSHLIKNCRKINCNTANYVPFVVPGLSTSFSTSSPPSSSQNTVIRMENPATEGSETMSEESRWNLSHGPAETENPNKNDDNEEVQGNLSHDLPEWQQVRKMLVI